MSWNYRIMKKKFPSLIHPGSVEYAYGLHEVYYKDDGVTPEGWTEDSLIGYFENVRELRLTLQQMLTDVSLREDVLEFD